MNFHEKIDFTFFALDFNAIEPFLSRKRRLLKPVDYRTSKKMKWNAVHEKVDLSESQSNTGAHRV